MPRINDYHCEKCDRYLIDHLHMTWPDNPPKCPECGDPMKRVFSKMNFELKGLGWACDGYSTDIDEVEKYWERDKPGSAPFSHLPG